MANALYRLGNYQKATRYLRSTFIIDYDRNRIEYVGWQYES